MKNLSQFKEALQVGTIWEFYHSGTGMRRISPVVMRQSNAVAFQSSSPGKGPSWLSFPKASECKFIDDNTVRIYFGDMGDIYLEYKRV